MKNKTTITAVIFLAVILVFTFVSRSVYNYNLPRVTASKLDYGFIELTTNSIAKLEYKTDGIVKASSDWMIADINVTDGKKVSEGDLLCTFNTQASDAEIKTLELNVMKAQRELSRLNRSIEEAFDDYTYQQAINNAETILNRKQAELVNAQEELIVAQQSQSPPAVLLDVERAKKDLQDAEDLLTKTESVLKRVQDERQDESVISFAQASFDDAQRLAVLARQAFDYVLLVQQGAQEALSSNIKIAQKVVSSAQQAVDDAYIALDAANANLIRAREAYSKNLNTINEQKTEAIAILSMAQNHLNEVVSNAPPANGIVAPCDGKVYGMVWESGDIIPSGEIVVEIIPDDAKAELVFNLPSDIGIHYGRGSIRAVIQTVSSKGEYQQEYIDGYIISNIMSDGVWKVAATIKSIEGRPLAGQDIPLQAKASVGGGRTPKIQIGSLFSDGNGGKCIYIIDQRQGLFGLENYVVQRSVSVAYDNGMYASLEFGSMNGNYTLANNPSKDINDGDVVWVRD